jgi:hypothetical protein
MSTDETPSRASALLHRPTFMLRDTVRRKSVGAGLLAKAVGPQKNMDGRNAIAGKLLHRHTSMLRDRVRRKSVGAGLLAKALGPRKLYRLPKRYRGQARSYTVLHSCCEIACAANPVGAGLLAKALGPRKLYRLPKRYRGQARSYTVIHPCCQIACAANPVGAGLLAKAVGPQKNVDGRNAIAGKRAPTPSCVVAMSSPVPQAHCRSALARERVGLPAKMLNEPTSSLCAAPLQSSRVSTSSNSISNTRSECGLMCAPMDLSP